MRGDHLDLARELAGSNNPGYAIAHALIDIAESLRTLTRKGSVRIDNMTVTSGSL